MWLMGWGGATVLGAVDSLPVGVTEVPEERGTRRGVAGPGCLGRPRFYDYGPGGNFGVHRGVRPRRAHVCAASATRGATCIRSTASARITSWGAPRSDLLLPLRGRFGFGASAEYLIRHTYYQDADRTEAASITTRSFARTSRGGCRDAALRIALRRALAASSRSSRRRPEPRPLRNPFRGHGWPTAPFETLAGGGRRVHHPAGRLSDLRGGFSVPPRGQRVRRHRVPRATTAWTSAPKSSGLGLDTADGRIRTTHFDAVAQFRPWRSQGFFLKGGAGMAFVRNWVDATGPDAINSKALSVVIGAGWVFNPPRASACRCSACSTPGRSATCRRPRAPFPT